MSDGRPHLIVIGGPNGAGKTTSAPFLLRDELAVNDFVNADWIAQGLSGFGAPGAAVAAGRIMLARLKELARKRADFAFESTLASVGLARWIGKQCARGYHLHLVHLWLPHPDLAVARVRLRVRMGGHDVPEETIRRRFQRGLQNFFRLYRPLADTWRFYDNAAPPEPRLIASGSGEASEEVRDEETWRRIRSSA